MKISKAVIEALREQLARSKPVRRAAAPVTKTTAKKAALKKSAKKTTRKSPAKQTWVWYWVGGGYNSTQASTRAEALKKAKAMGKPRRGVVALVVDEKSLHVAAPGELRSLDMQHS